MIYKKNKNLLTDPDTAWKSPFFLIMLVLKVSASFFFASWYMRDLFIPFINRFALTGLTNPWNFFYQSGQLNMFPYPSAMLWLMALPRILFAPFLANSWETVTALHLFIFRIPLLIFDLLLYWLLLQRFPVHKKRVTLIYWCSPIVFFISYIHGQLDIIPTALFFLGIHLLTHQKNVRAFLIFAIASACKSHVLIAMPFILVYLYKERIGIRRILLCLGTFVASYAALLSPYASSEAFQAMVFNSPEQAKFFSFSIPISTQLSLLVCPSVIALLFMKFASYKKLNREILFMFLGVVFAAFVIFVPPMPGWFLWSLPFLIYFYVSNKDYSRAPFVIYNAIYLFYFVFFFEKKDTFILPGKDPALIDNLALSLLMSTVGFIALWMFRLGIEKNEALKAIEAPVLIGIGGDSGSGKHTLLSTLRLLTGKDKSVPIFGDNFHRWERGDENWNVYSHLHPEGNKLHDEMDLAVAFKDGKTVELGHYDHKTGKFTDPKKMAPNKFVFFVGLHPFYLKKMRDIMNVKVFLDTEESLRRHWKIRRDMRKRGYSKERVIQQIEDREKDAQKFIQPQARFADLIIRLEPLELFSEEVKNPALKVRYRMDNSIDLEQLIRHLRLVPSLEVQHEHGLDYQELEVSGQIPPRAVMTVAYNLNLNFDELHVRTNRWAKNLRGLHQLVFLIVYHHKMEARK